MDRREFLKADDFRTLYGDGVHDDTDALSDMLAGKPVWYKGELRKATEAISSETGRVSRCVDIPLGVYLVRRR